MKNIFEFKSSLFLYIALVFSLSNCTDLKEEVLDGVLIDPNASTTINTTQVLADTYRNLGRFQDHTNLFLCEMTTDCMVRPTRGSDGDDNARWRQLHTHTWDATHQTIASQWNYMLTIVGNCDLVIDNSTNETEINAARFMKALCYFVMIDMFRQVPYRVKGEKSTENPKVMYAKEATVFAIAELEDIVDKLPARIAKQAYTVNADAAHALLAKFYLNKSVFMADNPAGPFTFSPDDMDKVITHADAITTSGLETNYWKNFATDNDASNEILFSCKNIRGTASIVSIRSWWTTPAHYNSIPGASGSNGHTVNGEYYDRFEATDKRRSYNGGSSTSNIMLYFGNPIGMQIGQMYANSLGSGGFTPLSPLKDRRGNPLIFEWRTELVTFGNTLETAGIRGIKYEPDYNGSTSKALRLNSEPENDYVILRYADVLLLKAEACLRGATKGGATEATAILKQIAGRAGATPLPTTLQGVIDERAKELWYECSRRTDLIRHQQFCDKNLYKPVTDPHYIVFPIPITALNNPNLKQNPGY